MICRHLVLCLQRVGFNYWIDQIFLDCSVFVKLNQPLHWRLKEEDSFLNNIWNSYHNQNELVKNRAYYLFLLFSYFLNGSFFCLLFSPYIDGVWMITLLYICITKFFWHVFYYECYTAAKIGEGILLDHGTGLVIGETAVVGNRVSLMQASMLFFPFITCTFLSFIV